METWAWPPDRTVRTYCFRASILSSSSCFSRAPIHSSNRSLESSLRGMLRRKSCGRGCVCQLLHPIRCQCLASLAFAPSQCPHASPGTHCPSQAFSGQSKGTSFRGPLCLRNFLATGRYRAHSQGAKSGGTRFRAINLTVRQSNCLFSSNF